MNPVQIHYHQSSGESWVPEKRLCCWLFYEVKTESQKHSTLSTLLCSVPAQDAALLNAPNPGEHQPVHRAGWSHKDKSLTWDTLRSFTESEINTGIRCMCTHLDFGVIYDFIAYYWVEYTHNSLGFGGKK